MTTTVTTVTVTTVTIMGLSAALGLVAALTLVALLISKEIATAGPGRDSIHWGRIINIGLIPLLLSFAVIVGIKAAEIV